MGAAPRTANLVAMGRQPVIRWAGPDQELQSGRRRRAESAGLRPPPKLFRPLHTFRFLRPVRLRTAFGYGAPHLSARGASSLLNNALLSTRFRLADYPARSHPTKRVVLQIGYERMGREPRWRSLGGSDKAKGLGLGLGTLFLCLPVRLADGSSLTRSIWRIVHAEWRILHIVAPGERLD